MRTPETKEVVTHWKVFFRKSLSKVTCEKKLARIEHVLIVKVYFERRKIAKVFMTHVQGFVRKSLSKATFERKLSIVSLSLQQMKKRKLLTDVTLRRYFWFACFRHRNAICVQTYTMSRIRKQFLCATLVFLSAFVQVWTAEVESGGPRKAIGPPCVCVCVRNRTLTSNWVMTCFDLGIRHAGKLTLSKSSSMIKLVSQRFKITLGKQVRSNCYDGRPWL